MKGKLFGLAVVIASVLPARGFDDQDWQWWSTEGVEYKTAPEWSTKGEVETYLSDDMSDLYYRHADIGLSRRVTSWFALGLNYRLVEQERNGEWKRENRPHLNGTFSLKAGPVRIADRNRIEYRERENASDLWRYRNRLRVGWPLERTRMILEPYVHDEIFIDSEQEQLSEHRASAGLALTFATRVKVEAYYMQISYKKDDEWLAANILGTSLTVSY